MDTPVNLFQAIRNFDQYDHKALAQWMAEHDPYVYFDAVKALCRATAASSSRCARYWTRRSMLVTRSCPGRGAR